MEKDKEYGDMEYPVYKDKEYEDTEYPAYKNKEYKDEEYPAYKDSVDEEYPAYKNTVDEEYPVYKNKVDLEYPTYKNKEYENEEYPAYKDKVERDSEDWMRPTQEFNAVTEHSADWNRIKDIKDDWSSVKKNYTDERSKMDEPAEFYNRGDDWSSVKNGHKKDWSAVKTNYEQDWPSAKKFLDEVKPLETGMEEIDWLPVQKEKENWKDQDRDQSSPDSQSRDELESPNLPYVQGALKIQLTDRGYNNGMENSTGGFGGYNHGMENSTGGFGGYNHGMENSNKEFGEKALFAPRTFANEGSEGENTAPNSVNYLKDTESSDDERHESSEDEDEGRGEVVGSLSFKIPTREYAPRETFKEKLNAEDDKDVDETDLTYPDQFMNMINKPVYSVQGELGKNKKEDENSSSDEERNESPNYMVEKPGDGIWKMVEHDSEIEKNKTELNEEEPTELEIRTETKTSNFLESEPEIKKGLDDFYNSGNVVSGFLDSALSSLQINGLCKTKVNLFFNNLQKVSTVLDITDHLSI